MRTCRCCSVCPLPAPMHPAVKTSQLDWDAGARQVLVVSLLVREGVGWRSQGAGRGQGQRTEGRGRGGEARGQEEGQRTEGRGRLEKSGGRQGAGRGQK